MKLTKITEAKYAGSKPALVSVDWGEYTEVYGPFKGEDMAEKFVQSLWKMITDTGLTEEDAVEVLEVFDISANVVQPPEEAVSELQKRISVRFNF